MRIEVGAGASGPQAICPVKSSHIRNPRSPSMSSKDNFEFAHEHRREVAWMSENTNTLPVHPKILAAIRQSVEEREINLYPPKACVPGLVHAILVDQFLAGSDALLTN